MTTLALLKNFASVSCASTFVFWAIILLEDTVYQNLTGFPQRKTNQALESEVL